MSSARTRQLIREIRKLRAARRIIVVTVREPGDSAPPAAPAGAPASDRGAVRVTVKAEAWTVCRRPGCQGHISNLSGCSRCGRQA